MKFLDVTSSYGCDGHSYPHRSSWSQTHPSGFPLPPRLFHRGFLTCPPEGPVHDGIGCQCSGVGLSNTWDSCIILAIQIPNIFP